MQISATAAFCLGLTILSIGYIFVEILRGDDYFFRKSLKRNKKHRLDRVIHYIIRGVLINFVFILLGSRGGIINHIAELLKSSGVIAKVIGTTPNSVTSIQLIFFSVGYFIALLMVMIMFRVVIKYSHKISFKKLKKRK